MALLVSGVGIVPSQLNPGYHRLPAKRHIQIHSVTITSSSRLKNAVTWQINEKLSVACASSSTGSGNSIFDKSDGITSDATTKGPPFLTILAGFMVFFIICWVLGSFITWMFGLVVKGPPSK